MLGTVIDRQGLGTHSLEKNLDALCVALPDGCQQCRDAVLVCGLRARRYTKRLGGNNADTTSFTFGLLLMRVYIQQYDAIHYFLSQDFWGL